MERSNKFSDKYTTNEKITKEEKDAEIKDKKEKTKTIISNDAYAISEMVQQFNMNIQNLIRSFAK